MRGPKIIILACLLTFLAAASDLAPTGTLRAAFLGTNTVQGTVDPKTGVVSGPIADLVQEMARREGVPFVILPAANAGEVTRLVNEHKADIGFLAYDVQRAADVDFTTSYALMYNTYVVPARSAIQKAADMDRPGIKVGSVRGQTQQLFLSDNLKKAEVKIYATMPSLEDLEKMLLSGELDAFGANRQRMEDAAARFPTLRALADNFSVVEQAVVVEKGDKVRAAWLDRFLEDVRTSGFVKASLDRAKLSGVGVATGPKR